MLRDHGPRACANLRLLDLEHVGSADEATDRADDGGAGYDQDEVGVSATMREHKVTTKPTCHIVMLGGTGIGYVTTTGRGRWHPHYGHATTCCRNSATMQDTKEAAVQSVVAAHKAGRGGMLWGWSGS